jgi:hypothetical protein
MLLPDSIWIITAPFQVVPGTLEDSSWFHCRSISADALNHGHKFLIAILKHTHMRILPINQDVCLLANAHLNTLLIHVVNVLRGDLILSLQFLKQLKESGYIGMIQTLCTR